MRSNPSDSNDFLKIAYQRLDAADFLIEGSYNKDGMYLAGYGIECALKALILHLTPVADRAVMLKRITAGASMHSDATLGQILKSELGTPLPLELVRRFRRFDWSPAMRYETGREAFSEARGLWKTAKATCEWVQEQLK